MSFVCGLFERNGKRADEGEIDKMIEAGLTLNEESISHLLSPPCVKQLDNAIAGVTTWPHSRGTQLGSPVHLEGNLLTWTGRLDNRDELVGELNERGASLTQTVTDDEIVAWGVYLFGCEVYVKKMIGDYAFAVVENNKNEVFFARSPFGVRELYYLVSASRTAWASNLAQIIPILTETIDEKHLKVYIAEYLCCTAKGRMAHTPYRNVYKLLPGRFLRISTGGLTSGEIWSPDETKAERYSKNEEYEERFRQLLSTAIRRRLSSCGSNGIQISLSGGLDSSTIACMIGHMRENGESLPKIRLFTNVYPGQGDESEYARTVAKQTTFPLEIASSIERNWLLKGCDSLQRLPEPQESILENRIGLEEELKQSSLTPYMTGLGGDQILTGDLIYLAGYLKKWKMTTFFNQIRQLSQISKQSVVSLAVQYGLKPVLDRSQVQFRRRGIAFRITTETFRKQYTLKERLESRYLPVVFSDPSAQDDYENLLSVHQWSCPGFSILDTRTPYLDIDLVEFCLTLPGKLRNDGLRDRVIMRRAMEDILPPRILHRRSGGSTEDSITFGLNKEWHRIESRLGNFYLAQLDIISNENLEILLRRAKAGALRYDVISAIQILTLEFWLETILGHESNSTFHRH